MLIELGVVEQRHKAVLEVMGGLPVTEVARRYGVTRQTVHRWLRWYAQGGIAALADGSSPPGDLPAPDGARGRGAHRGRCASSTRLGAAHARPLPGARGALPAPQPLLGLPLPRAPPPDRAAEAPEEARGLPPLGAPAGHGALADGRHGRRAARGRRASSRSSPASTTTRASASARSLTPRATARPVCEAFLAAMRRHGVPEQVLTDNGKVFTARFGRGSGLVLFDRICRENGIRHLLTAPRSPTTTGKVERFHKTVRSEFLAGPRLRLDRGGAGGARRLGRALQQRASPPGHRHGRAAAALRARRRSAGRSCPRKGSRRKRRPACGRSRAS